MQTTLGSICWRGGQHYLLRNAWNVGARTFQAPIGGALHLLPLGTISALFNINKQKTLPKIPPQLPFECSTKSSFVDCNASATLHPLCAVIINSPKPWRGPSARCCRGPANNSSLAKLQDVTLRYDVHSWCSCRLPRCLVVTRWLQRSTLQEWVSCRHSNRRPLRLGPRAAIDPGNPPCMERLNSTPPVERKLSGLGFLDVVVLVALKRN